MPSLGDAYDEAADAWEGRRLYVGAALLFVGAVVAAPGLVGVVVGALTAAGVGEGTALTVGIAVAGLAVPVVGAGLLRWVPSTSRIRRAAAAGVLLSALAVAAFVVTVPPDSLASAPRVPAAIVVAYLAGAMLALWSPIVAAGLAASESRSTTSTDTAYVRQTRSVRPRGRVPADGGKDEEEQLAFLLDNDDR